MDHLVGLETMLSAREEPAGFTSIEEVFRSVRIGSAAGKDARPVKTASLRRARESDHLFSKGRKMGARE